MIKIKLLLVFLSTIFLIQCKPSNKQNLPLIDSQHVFLYYTNMDEAVNFYENILQFRKTYDDGWVKIYKTTANSSVGLVDFFKTGYKEDAEKQVMLSFQVSNIKGWYSYMQQNEIVILEQLAENENTAIKAFLIEDPGGYKVEFFKWNKK